MAPASLAGHLFHRHLSNQAVLSTCSYSTQQHVSPVLSCMVLNHIKHCLIPTAAASLELDIFGDLGLYPVLAAGSCLT